jgi:FtsP/CotA-like multicopper oxidase with cupredoxin domain
MANPCSLQLPSAHVFADWGDTIQVTVINNLQTNGFVPSLPHWPVTDNISTGIHWHGIRQLNNNINDGASGVTECPIPPGKSKTYTFLATQYGTSWYGISVLLDLDYTRC